MDGLYVDEPCVVSFFIGELGWFLQKFQGYLRFLKEKKYPDHKFVVMTNLQFYPIIEDFVKYTLDLPDEFYKLNLETDCYEAPVKGSPPGSLTPSNIWSSLIKYIRNFYNVDKAIELWTPRGYNTFVDGQPQTFKRYEYPAIKTDSPVICVFPRERERAPERNVPEFVWKQVVDSLRESFTVVLGGTPSGSCLANYTGNNIVNLISYNEQDKLEKIMRYICSSVCTVSSQSGLSHVSLLCNTPTYMIGHERDRHCVTDNRLSAPVSFRMVNDYRAVSPEEILNDLNNFIKILRDHGMFSIDTTSINRPSLRSLIEKKNMVGVEIGVDRGENAENILNNLDVKKLYLVDPYDVSDGMIGLGCQMSQKQCEEIEKEAKDRLSKYSDRIIWVRGRSQDVVDEIPDNLDFVYIDGNHRYEFVKRDIENYFSKVKEGGLLAGHDYNYKDVKTVVDNFDGEKYELKTGKCVDKGTDWWIVKDKSFDLIINEGINSFNKLIEDRG